MSSGLKALSAPCDMPTPLEFRELIDALQERALVSVPEADPEDDEEDEDEDEEGDEDEDVGDEDEDDAEGEEKT